MLFSVREVIEPSSSLTHALADTTENCLRVRSYCDPLERAAMVRFMCSICPASTEYDYS